MTGSLTRLLLVTLVIPVYSAQTFESTARMFAIEVTLNVVTALHCIS